MASRLPIILVVAGTLSVSAGAALVSLAVGLIVAGIAAVGFGLLLADGKGAA